MIKCFVFKRGLLWIGWIVVKKDSPQTFYYDNTPCVTMYAETSIKYLTFGLSKKSVAKRIEKWIDRQGEM